MYIRVPMPVFHFLGAIEEEAHTQTQALFFNHIVENVSTVRDTLHILI